jgi:DNA-binding transcriptional MerR regulator
VIVLIGELSRRTGVNAHQLRYYEDQGLLQPRRRASGYREYADADVLTVVQIRKLLAAGLSTQDIAYLLPCATGAGPDLEPCQELVDALRDRLTDMEEQLDALARSRDTLHDYLDATERRMVEPAPA